MSDRLDEPALRRPDFDDGVAVELADGQEWTFPALWYRTFPRKTEGGGVETVMRVTYGPEHDADLEILFGSKEAEAHVQVDAMTRLAATLLLRNYDLDDDALAKLLPFDARSESSQGMWGRVVRAIRGERPKPSAAGSDGP